MSAIAARPRIASERHPLWLLGAAAVGWLALYRVLLPFWDWMLYDVLSLPQGMAGRIPAVSSLKEALAQRLGETK